MRNSGKEVSLPDSRFWFKELELGLRIWSGVYEEANGLWLRWYDSNGLWIPSDPERAEQEKERAEQEKERAERAEVQMTVERARAEQAKRDYQSLLKKLQEKGVELDTL